MIKTKLFMSVLFASLSTYTLAANTHSMDSDKGYLDGINGNLVTYCAADETACKAVIDMFNADVAAANSSGSFEAKFVRLSTSEMLARVKGELEKSAQAVKRKCKDMSGDALETCKEATYKAKVDVAFYGTDDPYKASLEDDLFSPYDYASAGDTHPWSADLTVASDSRLGGLYLGLLAMGVNTELAAKAGVDIPQCWADLAKSDYDDSVTIANWNTSGTAYKFAATVLQAFGSEEAGWEKVIEIHQSINQYTKSGSAGVKMAARGETMVGIGFGHDIVALMQQGFPIELVAPCEGVLYEIGPVGIVRGAPNRDAAEAFVQYLYEPSTQEVLASVGSLQFPSNLNAAVPDGAPAMENFKLLVSDPSFSEKDKKNQIIKKWTDEIFPLPR